MSECRSRLRAARFEYSTYDTARRSGATAAPDVKKEKAICRLPFRFFGSTAFRQKTSAAYRRGGTLALRRGGGIGGAATRARRTTPPPAPLVLFLSLKFVTNLYPFEL